MQRVNCRYAEHDFNSNTTAVIILHGQPFAICGVFQGYPYLCDDNVISLQARAGEVQKLCFWSASRSLTLGDLLVVKLSSKSVKSNRPDQGEGLVAEYKWKGLGLTVCLSMSLTKL